MKKIVALILALVLAFGLVACGGSGAEGNKESRTELNVRTATIPGVLIPYQSSNNIDFTLVWNIFDTLVDATDTYLLDLKPSLAKKWEVSDDGLEYTFYLRDDVDFHNGEHFTAEDVAYTWAAVKASGTTSGKAAAMERWEIIDDYTIKLYLNMPQPYLLNLFATYAFGIVNKEAIEANGQSQGAYVGTGPYVLDTYNPNELIVLKANEKHFDGAPPIKTVNVKVISDNNSALVAFRNGELDIMDVPYLDAMAMKDDKDIEIFDRVACQVYSITFNTTKAPLDNLYVRQAINYALDREAIALIVSDGLYPAAQLPIIEGHPGYTTEVEYPYDPAKARELLQKSGLSPEELTITLTHYLDSSSEKWATAVQDQLKEVGITVELEGLDSGVVTQKFLARESTMSTFVYGGGPYNPGNTFNAIIHTNGNWNMSCFTGSRADEMNRLIGEAVGEIDTDKAAKLFEDAMKIFREEALSAPCFSVVSKVAANKNLKGIFIDNAAGLIKFYRYYWE